MWHTFDSVKYDPAYSKKSLQSIRASCKNFGEEAVGLARWQFHDRMCGQPNPETTSYCHCGAKTVNCSSLYFTPSMLHWKYLKVLNLQNHTISVPPTVKLGVSVSKCLVATLPSVLTTPPTWWFKHRDTLQSTQQGRYGGMCQQSSLESYNWKKIFYRAV